MTQLKYKQINGLRFAYFDEGQGPLVVLLHGFPDTPHTWDHIRPVLVDEGYRVVAPFMRGYAPTEIPQGSPTARDLGQDVIALIDACGEETARVVGHDWGAVAAYAATALKPERVSRLFTTAVPHLGAVKPNLRMLWFFRHFIGLNLPGAGSRVRKNNFAYLDTLYRRWSPTWDLDESELDHIRACFAEPGCAEAAVAYYHMMRKSPEKFVLGRITVPTRSVAGADDPGIPPETYEKARRFFKSEYDVVTLAGGHFVHRENPEPFIETLLDWFK